jgi:hypothetical protein
MKQNTKLTRRQLQLTVMKPEHAMPTPPLPLLLVSLAQGQNVSKFYAVVIA